VQPADPRAPVASAEGLTRDRHEPSHSDDCASLLGATPAPDVPVAPAPQDQLWPGGKPTLPTAAPKALRPLLAALHPIGYRCPPRAEARETDLTAEVVQVVRVQVPGLQTPTVLAIVGLRSCSRPYRWPESYRWLLIQDTHVQWDQQVPADRVEWVQDRDGDGWQELLAMRTTFAEGQVVQSGLLWRLEAQALTLLHDFGVVLNDSCLATEGPRRSCSAELYWRRDGEQQHFDKRALEAVCPPLVQDQPMPKAPLSLAP
jgi:hypothetical protein